MEAKDFMDNKHFLCNACSALATVKLEFGESGRYRFNSVFLCEEHLHKLREIVVDMEIKHGY